MKSAVTKLRAELKIYTDKRFSTIAGTLVYFLLMSIAPFIVWLTLLLGSIDIQRFISSSLFDSILPFLTYLEQSAQSAASGAGLILLITSLYSSTNFFYHLRRSGEIIFQTSHTGGGIKLRVISAALIILTILLLAFLAAFAVTGRWILATFMPEILCDIISFLYLGILAFFCAVLLNLFACPYKLRVGEVIKGSLITSALWLIFIVGFAIYLRFASPGKLYGAIASVIIFLLWCYFMMCCLVIGMIKNGEDINVKKLKKFL